MDHRRSESHVVELASGTEWQIFPVDLEKAVNG